MSEEKIKYICITHRCGWKGISTEVLKELNPFDEREIILGCPKCKDVNTVVLACDEADCWEKLIADSPQVQDTEELVTVITKDEQDV